MELSVACHVRYIDFEGRSDGTSVMNILEHVRPRNLIIIHGSESETEVRSQGRTALGALPEIGKEWHRRSAPRVKQARTF